VQRPSRHVRVAILAAACGGADAEVDPSTTGGPASTSTSGDGSDGGRDGTSSAGTSSAGDELVTTGELEGSSSGDDTSTSTGTGTVIDACAIVGIEGTCVDVVECPAGDLSVLGTCDDVPAVQCCLPDAIACSVDGAPGLCLPTAMCPPGMTRTAGLCPGDADVQCCSDPSTACDPAAAPTPNDGLEEDSIDPGCPPGMVLVEGFCIDRWEAALALVDDGGRTIGSHSPFVHPGGASVRAVSIRGAVPQAYIDGETAEAACVASGKRLCTDTEWLRACQGAAGHTYPYGDALEPGRCNDARETHPAIEYFGTADAWIWSELGHPCIAQLPDGLQVTGAFAACESDDGVLDMMGNLHEWTADPDGTFRGGFYVDTALNGPGCLYATTAHDRTHWDYSTGFRCCADPA
jgi:sulfatase modifying factor 1